jgi:hypothetical protein
VKTHLFHGSAPFVKLLVATVGRFFMISPEEGAKTSLYLATSPEVAGKSGAYYNHGAPARPSAAAMRDADAERLWEISASLVALPP